MERNKYDLELNVAVRVVHLVCSLCQKVQKQLLSTNPHQVKSKDDDSPVTVAGMGFSSLFVSCKFLVFSDVFGLCPLFDCLCKTQFDYFLFVYNFLNLVSANLWS